MKASFNNESSPSKLTIDLFPRSEKSKAKPLQLKEPQAPRMTKLQLTFCIGFVFFETTKQMTTYASIGPDGKYAIDGSLTVVLAEALKFVIALALTISLEGGSFRASYFSWLFAVPAVLFVANANIFMIALHFAAPPLWTVLIQGRILLTAAVYRCFFRRRIGAARWAALIALTVGVILSQVRPDMSGMYPSLTAVALAAVACSISVASSMSVELLLKQHSCPFLLQQVQLYFFGFISSSLFWLYAAEPGAVAGAFGHFATLPMHEKVPPSFVLI